MRTRTARIIAIAVATILVSPAWAGRPAAGQGGVFIDAFGSPHFEWTDLGDDFLQVSWDMTKSADFARATPNGAVYVHAGSKEATMSAIVGGVAYSGHGSFQTSYFGDCTLFDPAHNAFNCFIGPGPATMEATGEVVDDATGETCALDARLTAFYAKQNACEALFGESCPGGALVVPSFGLYDIKVTCPR
jgi:hypothetical protein